MARFKPRELREGLALDELRRELNEIQKAIRADLDAVAGASPVTSLQTTDYTARYGDVVRVAPPSGGLRLILPPVNLAQPNGFVTVVVETATGALTAEAVDSTINGATTLVLLAGIGTVEFRLTPTGWYAWSASLQTIPLTSLATQATDTMVANVTAGTAPPTAVGLSTLAGAGLAFASHTLDVTGSTSITVTSDQVQRAALTGAVTAGANVNATLFGTGAAGNGLSGDGTATLDHIGSASRLVLSGSTGNLGTVDISTLLCGGSLFLSGVTGNWQIEGFSTKPAGFWFSLAAGNTAFTGQLLNEDATPTAALRLRVSGFVDSAATLAMQAIVFRNGNATSGLNRWSCVL